MNKQWSGQESQSNSEPINETAGIILLISPLKPMLRMHHPDMSAEEIRCVFDDILMIIK